jgi:predicted secreted protein
MSDKKQTAVEWLINEIKFARNLCDDPSAEMDIWHTLDVLIAKGEQAKEMEKEQKRKDFTDGYMHGNEPLNHNVIDKWYNETFGGGNK